MLKKRFPIIFILITALLILPQSASGQDIDIEAYGMNPNTTVSDNIGIDTIYTATLDYTDYYFIWFLVELDRSDIVSWSFTGSDSTVGIIVYAMDDFNFGLWDSGQTAMFWTLSDGRFYSDFDQFVPPDFDIWYFVFWNNDPVQRSTTVTIDISSSKAEPSFYSFTYLRYDTDSDGYYDSVTATFDPDMPTGWPNDNEGEVEVFLDLYNAGNTFIKSTSSTYFPIGNTRLTYDLSMGDISDLDSFYIYATIYAADLSIASDTFTTTEFAIAPLGFGYPYVGSVDLVGVDSNSDGYDDRFTVNYDINFNEGLSGDVDVKIELIEDSTLKIVETFTKTHTISGTTIDNFSNTFDSVTDYDNFYVNITLRSSGTSTYQGETSSSSLSGYPLDALVAEIFDSEYLIYSSDEINDDSVKVFADPNFLYEGVSESITIVVDLYNEANTLIKSVQDNFVITFDFKDWFELDLGVVQTSGQYWVELRLYLVGETTELDSVSSLLFNLSIEESSSIAPTSEGNGDGGGENSRLPEIPFSRLSAILISFSFLGVMNMTSKRKRESN